MKYQTKCHICPEIRTKFVIFSKNKRTEETPCSKKSRAEIIGDTWQLIRITNCFEIRAGNLIGRSVRRCGVWCTSTISPTLSSYSANTGARWWTWLSSPVRDCRTSKMKSAKPSWPRRAPFWRSPP